MYNVVLAEDELLTRQGFVSMLDWKALGLQIVCEASNGKEALEAIDKHSPHILITDIRMPIMDGIALIEAVRRTNSEIKVVILTCVDDFALIQKAINLGVSSYILKLTADIKEIEDILKKICLCINDENNKKSETALSAQGLLREQLCLDFICRRTLLAENFENAMLSCPLPLSQKNLCVAKLLLPSEDVLSQTDLTHEKLVVFLQGLMKSLFALYGVGEIFFDLDKNAIFVLGFGEMSLEKANALQKQMIGEIRHSVKHFLDFPVMLGISEFANNYSFLPELYRAADANLRDKSQLIYPPKLMAVISFLKENYCENISLQEAADFVNVTPNYLSKLFAQAGLESFTTLINKMRIAKAKALLRDPACPVYRVGEQIGFPNSTYFIRVFKKHTGVTPYEFRCQPLEEQI
ncbi:MAG: response regulator [Christensenella sp.]